MKFPQQFIQMSTGGNYKDAPVISHVSLMSLYVSNPSGYHETHMEDLLNLHKGIQGIHRPNYRMETIGARILLHQ
jgi:hypothetical protein